MFVYHDQQCLFFVHNRRHRYGLILRVDRILGEGHSSDACFNLSVFVHRNSNVDLNRIQQTQCHDRRALFDNCALRRMGTSDAATEWGIQCVVTKIVLGVTL